MEKWTKVDTATAHKIQVRDYTKFREHNPWADNSSVSQENSRIL